MTIAKLNVLFKKIQKDDKKEVLLFHVQGDDLPHANELLKMPGSITMLNVEESEAGEIGAEFVSIQRDDKKTVLKFHIKRDTEGKVTKFYPLAGSNVSITLQPSQMSIEEFYDDDREGIEYSVDGSGNVEVNKDQLSIDDVESEKKLQRVK
ncbi:hypothetical protein [Metabacillus idriensis]|uniref:hypothetical protein n=1 Tax=Metabacillus idriensis TaxID=324768 RepID=UPI001748E39B|nr:hypothetical protein [Metabacillus idriensis]